MLKKSFLAGIAFFLFSSLTVYSQELKIGYGPEGRMEITVGGEIVLSGLTMNNIPKPGNAGSYLINYSGVTEEGNKRVETYKIEDKGEEYALLERTTKETKEELCISWELHVKKDISTVGWDGVGIRGDIPKGNFAGSGIWYEIVRDDERLDAKLFPEETSQLSSWYGLTNWIKPTGTYSLGWLSKKGNGISLNLEGDLQFRITGTHPYQVNYFFPIGTFEKGCLYTWSMRIKPIDRDAFPKTALKKYAAGRNSMLYSDVSFIQISSKENRLFLSVNNLLPIERELTIKYRVTDDLLKTLKEGSFKELTGSMGRMEKEIITPGCPENNYRVFLDVIDEKNKVDEAFKMSYKFDITEGLRQKNSLSGQEWERLKGDAPLYPPKGDWEKCTVPLLSGPTDCGLDNAPPGNGWWYRRKFNALKDISLKRIFLNFENARGALKIYLNGKEVGTHIGRWTLCSFDITEYIKEGENTLELSIDKGPLLGGDSGEWKLGIWADVYLSTLPKVYVEDIFVITSVRKKEITLKGAVINKDTNPHRITLANQVYDKEGVVKEIPSQTIDLRPGEEKKIEITEPWKNPELWWQTKPHLYKLITSLKEGNEVVDRLSTRFGFREVWCDNDKLILNGRPIKMMGQWGTHFLRRDSVFPKYRVFRTLSQEEEMRVIIESVRLSKSWNLNAGVRIQFYPDWRYLDECDESGFLVFVEGACPLTDYDADPLFFERWKQHLREFVVRDRNHPAVIGWSTDNEYTAWNLTRKDFISKAAGLYDYVREIDPTRPVLNGNGGDILGKADIISIGYPNDPAFGLTNFPEDAYWFDKEVLITGGKFFWDRKKPFGSCEMGISYINPDGSCFWGAKGYEYSYRTSCWMGHIYAYKPLMRIWLPAWRDQGASIITPSGSWFPEYFDTDWYEPLYTGMREYDHNFYSEDKIERTLFILNDKIEPDEANLKLLWEVSKDKKVEERDESIFTLLCGEKKVLPVTFAVPFVSKRTDFDFVVTLYRDDKPIYTKTWNYTAFPKPEPISLDKEIGVYDIEGKTIKLFDRLNIKYKKIEEISLPLLKKFPLFIIGDNSLDKNLVANSKVITHYVSEGGKVISLKQKDYPEWLPIEGIRTSAGAGPSNAHITTISFPEAPHHPILEDVREEDLTFWHPGHSVSEGDLDKPIKGNFTILIDSGSMLRGLVWTSLVEIPYKKGYYFLSQLNLIDKFETEPIASQIFSNLLSYAFQVKPRITSSLGTLTEDKKELKYKIDSFGVVHNKIKDITKEKLDAYNILLIDSHWDEVNLNKDKLQRFVESGGKVWFHSLTPENIRIASEITGKPMWVYRYNPTSDPVGLMVKAKDTPLFSGLSNCELWWSTQLADSGNIPLSRPIINYAIVIEEDNEVEILTKPVGLVKINRGKGFFLLDQINWDRERQIKRGNSVLSCFLTNLGIEIVPEIEEIVIESAKKLTTEEMKKEKLVGYWSFDEGEGNVVKDKGPVGDDHNGIIHGSPKWVKGVSGTALEFDGKNDYVEIALYHPDYHRSIPKEYYEPKEMTVEVWLKDYEYTDHGCVIAQGPGMIANQFRFRIAAVRFIASGTLSAGFNLPGGGMIIDNPIKLNKWTHVVLVGDNKKTAYLYLDGVLMGTATSNPVSDPYDLYTSYIYPVRIGLAQDGRGFKGVVDEVKIYHRALSEKEVKAHYRAVQISE